MRIFLAISLVMFLPFPALAQTKDGNRLAYLDEVNPYYPSRTFPRLTTPQWIGEPGVEAVVILAIDDMRDPKRYEAFLRPVLRRLQKIDGRAPLSIMTNQVNPKNPQLQTWLKEGLSIECHTFDHPCPFFKGGFEKAKETYDKCVDLMHEIPNTKPVAFRMPCCDSLNTPSPRFYAEIFNKTTKKGNFLTIDTSVFNVFTANDPDLPRELVLNPDGSERFRKYLPRDRSFVNTIEDYPYPYVIGRLCWQFPCVTPSDWQANHLHKPNNPRTVADWKAVLDCTVIKKGIFCLVFHPHGWIRNDQVVELIDYADQKYGKKVKFLNFKEAQDRLTKKHGVKRNSYFEAWDWFQKERQEKIHPCPLPAGAKLPDQDATDHGLRLIDLDGDGNLDVIFSNEKEFGIYLFKDKKTGFSRKVMSGKRGDKDALPMISRNGTNNGFWVHSGSLWWSNEDTVLLKDHVDRRSIKELLKNVEPKAKSPEASLKAIKPRPGFTVELMAAEPLVQSPIAFAWGADGKFWVVEMGDYPLGLDGKGKPGGRVKFLEKTKTSRDRKGADDPTAPYDKATLFLDNLPFPTGIMPWGKGVLVTCAPDIFYAEDTDGDGKADKKIILYTGFNEGNQQHRVNGLVWGLDNWIYGANGDSGGIIKSLGRRDLKFVPPVNISGRDFRIKPDLWLIEAVTGQTQFGRCRDDWGNWFGCNNSNPMYHFVLDDHYLRRNPYLAAPNPKVQVSVQPGASPVYPISRTLPRFNDPHALNHFTSACSVIFYRDDLFGPALANSTFVSEPVHNLIHREVMTAKGVTFTSRRAADEQFSEFLASADNWFRPTTIQTGPDGALWVADMYRHVIEHPQWIPKDWQKKLDLRAGQDKGRIYRIYPVGTKPRAIPRLDKLTTSELVAALDGPSGWQRDVAQQLLVKKKDKSAVPLLEKTARACNRPQARVHALCTLDGLGTLTPAVLKTALGDPHPGVRKQAIRLCEPWLNKDTGLIAVLEKLSADSDPHVRMQLAYSWGEWDDTRSGKLLGELALRNHADPYLLAAVMSSVNKKNLGPVLARVMKPSSGVPPGVVLEKLLILARAFKYQQGLATVLAAIATPQDGRYSAGQFVALAALLDALDRRQASLDKLAALGNKDLKDSLAKLDGLFAAARKIVSAPGADPIEKVPAIALLGRGPNRRKEDMQLLARLLVPQVPDDIQSAAVTSLGRLKGPSVPALLLERWKSYPPALRAQVLDVLLSRPDWTVAALDALQKKLILAMEIDAPRRQRLLDHKQTDIRARAAKLLAETVNKDRRKVVEKYLEKVTDRGDGQLGAKVFARTCAACHQVAGIGQQVGPDLASVPDKSVPALLNAILDPNQAVEPRYVNYTAVTRNGLIHNGLLAEETGTSITLVSADGKKHVILRADLEELHSSGKSVMPEGLEKDISPDDMTNLIAFLRGNLPNPPRKVFPGNRPETIRPTGRGILHLTAQNCEIYGKTLVLEKQYGNLGYWSSTSDQALWTVDVPRTGTYEIWLEWACDNASAGNALVIQAGNKTMTAKVQGTGTWDHYRQARIGTIVIEQGKQTVLLRSAGPIRGSLLDLKAIKLVP